MLSEKLINKQETNVGMCERKSRPDPDDHWSNARARSKRGGCLHLATRLLLVATRCSQPYCLTGLYAVR